MVSIKFRPAGAGGWGFNSPQMRDNRKLNEREVHISSMGKKINLVELKTPCQRRRVSDIMCFSADCPVHQVRFLSPEEMPKVGETEEPFV